VALEEADLVLVVGERWVYTSVLHGEVVVDFALVDGSRGLGNQLSSEHVLTVPDGGLIAGDLDALVGGLVGRVLVSGPQVDVIGDWAIAVNVVLVLADFVGKAPVVELSTRGHVVESAIPEHVTCVCQYTVCQLGLNSRTSHSGASQGTDQCSLSEHGERVS